MKQQIHQLLLVSRTKGTASPKKEFPSLFTMTWTSHVRACVLDCSKHKHFNRAETEATTTVRQLQSRRLAHVKVLSLFLSIHWVNVQYALVILRLQDRPRRPRVEESELHWQLVCSLAVFSQRDNKLSLLSSLPCLSRFFFFFFDTWLPIGWRHQLVHFRSL